MKPRHWPALAACAGLLISGLAGATGALASATPRPAAAASGGAAHARSVNVLAAERGPQLPVRAWTKGPLGRDGRPAGASLPVRRDNRPKIAPAPPRVGVGGPNAGLGAPRAPRALRPQARATVRPLAAPTTVNANFNGINESNSNCGCQPPDTNDAVGLTQIVENVNLQLEVYTKTGVAQCGVGLNTFVGTTSQLSDPHVLYDNLNNRFLMDFTVVPTTGATPSMYVLASQTSNACGSWWVYRLTFFGSFYPAGTLLDFPYLGQDRVSALVSTNNFCCAPSFGYRNSAAFSIAKSLLYAGQAVSFTSYGVALSTAPVTVSGIPIASTTTTYFLASVPGTGYDLYKMTTGPNNPITLQAVISSPFNAPSRRVNQPGTSQTLDPLDGRIVWDPVESQGFVWFAHGVDRSGFPSVRYGAINAATNTPFVAAAYHSATSDDFNPSIGIADAGTNVVYAWVNWAYTDTSHGIPTSDAINGVLPGTGVPNLIGTELTLVRGASTSSNFRFGDISSVEVDPTAVSSTCPAGRTAVTNQEFFDSNGQWDTRLARTSFC